MTTTEKEVQTIKNKIAKIEKSIAFHTEKLKANIKDNLLMRLDRVAELKKQKEYFLENIRLIELKMESASTLVDQLKSETTDLLDAFIEQTILWASEKVKRNIERREKYYSGSSAFQYKQDYYEAQKWNNRTPASHFDEKLFTAEMIENSRNHYYSSIQKLAFRIIQKGLNESNIVVKNSSIGVNIGATITDGNTTVRAWTIVASGEVQRPHYRFLVK